MQKPDLPKNTLFMELLQVHSLTLFPGMVSSSRADMFASEIGQAPPLADANIRRMLTGAERRYGQMTDMVKTSADCAVLKVVHKNPPAMFGQFKKPTERKIIYQDVHTGAYGVIDMPLYSLNHPQFGFNFKDRDIVKTIAPGKTIPKDTILSSSPSLLPSGDYMPGINAKLAFMSINEVGQDGAVISESFAKRASFKGYGKRTLSVGSGTFALNLFGKDNEYKCFPDVGDKIPDSGLLFATREFREELGPALISKKQCKTLYTSDKKEYAVGGGTVIAVEVFKNPQVKPSGLPDIFFEQCNKYYKSDLDYHKAILDGYKQIKREVGHDRPSLTPEFREQLRVSTGFVNSTYPNNSSLNYVNGSSNAPLDEWTVIIHFSYDLTPTVRFKLADFAGGKAVVVEVWPDDRMPVDKHGTRAEVIMDGQSIAGRLNTTRPLEQYLNGSFDEAWRQVKAMVDKGVTPWDWLCKYYNIITPRFAEYVKRRNSPQQIEKHVKDVYRNGIYLHVPTDNPVDYVEVVKELEVTCPPCIDVVTYKNCEGETITTETPVLIADQYFIMLEKVGDDYSAVAAPLLQPQGIPSKLTRADKYASPGRPQAVRGIGETEKRILQAMTDIDIVPDWLDIANSPSTLRHVTQQLLTHETPTKIDNIIPRDVVPRGNNRITQHMNNFLMAGGFCFERREITED